jgi:hypothetical protein
MKIVGCQSMVDEIKYLLVNIQNKKRDVVNWGL